MRSVMVMILDMQKPNNMPDMMNLCPLAILARKMAMWDAAPMTKRTRNTAHIGTSRPTVGRPPRAAVVGGYGGCMLASLIVAAWGERCQLSMI